MTRYLYLIMILTMALGASICARADVLAAPPPQGADVLAPPLSRAQEPITSEESDISGDSILAFSGRIDGSFSTGSTVQQGFAIPSLRLNAFGQATDWIDYQLSLGQTREFSTAMLPQIIPMNASVRVSNQAFDEEESLPLLSLRFGMFTPTASPNWTPDLAYVDLPTYHESQRAMLLSPDIGTELAYEPVRGRLQLGVGIFNGNGNFSLNVNNSRALTAFLKGSFPLGMTNLQIGVGAYSLSQSTPGSNNYKSNRVADAFVALDSPLLRGGVDLLVGSFEDSFRRATPWGGAASLTFHLLDRIDLFSRAELLDDQPNGGGTLKHFQVGPEVGVLDSLKVFATYDYFENGLGSPETSAQVRVRLVF